MSSQAIAATRVFPRKRVSAGALFLNETGQILLVNPTYKPPWEIPGGMVEANETPSMACQREVSEEIGLTIEPGILLSVGYLQAHNANGDAIRFIFWGGILDGTTIGHITLQQSELSEFRFVTLDEAKQLVRPSLHAQLAQSLANLSKISASSAPQTYWEEG